MADFGVEVDLKPKVDKSEFESVLRGMKAEIPLEVNKAALQNSINSALGSIRTNKIKLDIDRTHLAAQVKQALSSVNIDVKDFDTKQNNPQTTSQTSWSATAKQISSAQRQLYKWEQSINRMQNSGLYSKSAVSQFRTQLSAIKQLETGTDSWAKAYEKLNMQYTKAVELQKTMRQQQNLQNSIDAKTKKAIDQESTATSQLMRWQQAMTRANREGFSSNYQVDFNDQLRSLDSLTAGTKEYQDAITQLKNSYTLFNEEYKNFRQQNTMDKAELRNQEHLNNLYRQASELLKNNKRIQGTSIQGTLQDIMRKSADGTGDFVTLSRDLSAARAQMEELGLTSETLGARLQRLFGDHMNTAIAMAGLHALQNAFASLLQNVVDVDTAMTDLQKVSNATSAEYEQFLTGAAGRAETLGATMTDVIGATSEFSRLGYDLNESSVLGDAAVKYLNVSEYTNIEDAAQSLVSTMQAFGIEADQVGSIVDKFNEIGNNYAISSQGLGEAMQRSAASLALAGNSLDESLALVTAANEVVQDPDVVGTWAKTLTMYLRAAKTEAEEAGVETEGMANSVSELRDSVLSLTGGRVDIMQDDKTFKSTVQIMREIAGVYDSMADVDQAALLELLSGKRQANTTAALISNWETVEKAIVSSQNAMGSADAENEKYINSIEGKLAQFQAKFQAASTSIIDSGLVKGTIDTGSGVLGAVQWLADNLGTIPGLIAPIISMIASIKGDGLFRLQKNSDGTASITSIFDGILSGSKQLSSQLQKDQEVLQKYFSLGKNLSGDKLLDMFSGASDDAVEFAKNIDVAGMSSEQATKRLNEFTQTQQKASSVSTKFVNALKGIGSAFAGMLLVTAVSFAISKLIDVMDGLVLSASEAAEITSNVTQSFTSTSSQLQESVTQVESLRERFDELSKGVSDNGKNISLTTSEYEEYCDIVSELSSLNPTLVQGYNDENQAIIDKNNAIEDTISLLQQQRMEEAKNSVYGGRSENDGDKTNFETVVEDFGNQYRNQISTINDVATDISDIIYQAYKNANKQGIGDEVQQLLEETAGVKLSDISGYEEIFDMQGNKKQISVQADMYDLIEQNQNKLAQNLPYLISQFSELGIMSNEAAQNAQSLSNEYISQNDAIDNTASSLRTMMQALYESNALYYDLTDQQKNFLEMFRTNIPAEDLIGMSASDIEAMIQNLISSVGSNPQVASQINKMYDLIANKDSMPTSDFIEQGKTIAQSIASGIGMEDIDFLKLFGIDNFEADAQDIADTVASNFKKALSNTQIEGDSVDGLLKNIDFKDLSMNQLTTMNNLLANAGDRAAEFAARMSALASVGQLGTALNQVSEALGDQAGEFHTVTQAISDYQTATENLVSGVDNHETMVSIYDEFAASVNKGQINTEKAREQMELLIGDIVSLEDAKKWVSENEGLFLTGTDEDAIGQDLTGTLNSLHNQYNQLSADQQAYVDSLMNVDWDTGSIQVAQSDVVALADAFGMSAATLQQSLDLIESYSDYTVPTVQVMSQNIKTLNDAAYSLKQTTSETERETTKAWDKMSVAQKVALEQLTAGSDIDVTQMSVQDIDDLVSAYNRLKSALGSTPTSEALTNYFTNIKDSAGQAAAEVSRLSDGSWQIDITNLPAVAQELGTTEEKAKLALGAISQLRDDAGNPITLTINGQAVQTEADAAVGAFDEVASALEKEYHINVDAKDANNQISIVKQGLNGLKDKTITIKTVRVTQSQSNGYVDTSILRGGGGYTGITGRMTAMASGGTSPGGKTLVGELGRELWISRDGKRQKIVGKNGMEVITMRRGDAIVPNDITEALIRGGMSQAAGGLWAGSNSSGALSNLIYATGGNHTNWSAASSAASKVASAAKSASSVSESLEEQLDDLEKAFDDVLSTFEHSIFLLEEKDGPVQEVVSIYKEMQDAVHEQAEKYRKMGVSENSKYIQDLQKKWYEYRDDIVDAMTEAYDKILSSQKNMVTLTENWQNNAINDGDLILVERYANDMIASYKSMQDTLHDQAEYYRSIGYSDTSDEVSELSDLWWDYDDEIKQIKQSVVDNLMDIVSQTSDALDELQGVYDTFRSAADEYAENGGFISIDTYREIIDLGPQYMQYLKDENGLLNINEESLNRVIAAKTEQLALDSAMTYVERLRLALQQNSIEDLNELLGLTMQSTDATWGMVYASLALLNLGSDQYQAALHNINAIRALAQSASNGVGLVSGSLSDMRSGMEDFLQYVMDMLQQQVENQIDSLEDLKDSYAELIQLKKDSLDASRDETDYQEEVADKVKEIAKLQQQINALSLDDSRDAQAQRLALEEQMADLQKELADAQADYAYDAQVDSLDKMQDAYEEQKDAEIEKLEDSISSQQKLYDKAIAYIESHWDTLYDELIAWNYEYGNSLSSEIESAWESALAAAQKYGSFVDAMNATANIGSSSGNSGGSNITIGSTNGDGSFSDQDMISAIVKQMYRNSQQWHSASSSGKKQLDAENERLAGSLAQYGINAVRDDKAGIWYVDYIGGQELYDKYLKYHTGGIAGGKSTLRQNEMLAVLEQGEAILDQKKQDNALRMIDFVKALSQGISQDASAIDLTSAFGQFGANDSRAAYSKTTPSMDVSFGDVTIYGADGDTVKQHVEINRRFVNDVLDILNIRK